MRALLGVNVLIALVDGEHLAHFALKDGRVPEADYALRAGNH